MASEPMNVIAHSSPREVDDLSERLHERKLVERMLAGDERAFERFAADYIPIVHRFASRRIGDDRELAREISQATITKAITKLSSFRGESALATWLCACCKNEIAAHFRAGGPASKRAREVEIESIAESVEALPSHSSSPDRDLLDREQRHQVHATLDELPPRYGQALEWKYLDGLSVDEIANRLELSAKAAESLLTRARGAFRLGYTRLVAATTPNPIPSATLQAKVVES